MAADVTDPSIRVLVADDQTVVREGLELLLGLSPGIAVVGSAADGEDAVRLMGERRPDVVLMDLRMPRCDGVEATRRIARDFPATRVVVLTTYADDVSIFGALEAGARGYLTKGAGAQEIQRAIPRRSCRRGAARPGSAASRDPRGSGTRPPAAPRPCPTTSRRVKPRCYGSWRRG